MSNWIIQNWPPVVLGGILFLILGMMMGIMMRKPFISVVCGLLLLATIITLMSSHVI